MPGNWRFTHRTLPNDIKPNPNPGKAVQEATTYFTSGPGSAVTSQGLTTAKARQNAQDYADYGERPNDDFHNPTGMFTNLDKYQRLKTNAQNEQNKLAQMQATANYQLTSRYGRKNAGIKERQNSSTVAEGYNQALSSAINNANAFSENDGDVYLKSSKNPDGSDNWPFITRLNLSREKPEDPDKSNYLMNLIKKGH